MKIPKISGPPKTKGPSRISIEKVENMEDANQFLEETVEDFNTYELTKPQFLRKMNQYTEKVIEINK